MVNFGEFLKTWSLRPNSVTRQVSFDDKNWWKMPKLGHQMLRLQLGLKNSSYPNFYCAWGMQRIPKEELKSKPLFRFPYASNATTTTTKRCSRVVGTVLCPFLFLVIESIERMHFLTLWWRFFVPKHFVFTFLLFFSSGDHCYCILGRRKSGNCVSPYTWQLHPPDGRDLDTRKSVKEKYEECVRPFWPCLMVAA